MSNSLCPPKHQRLRTKTRGGRKVKQPAVQVITSENKNPAQHRVMGSPQFDNPKNPPGEILPLALNFSSRYLRGDNEEAASLSRIKQPERLSTQNTCSCTLPSYAAVLSPSYERGQEKLRQEKEIKKKNKKAAPVIRKSSCSWESIVHVVHALISSSGPNPYDSRFERLMPGNSRPYNEGAAW